MSYNFFVKFNLDAMRHDMELIDGDQHGEWLWLKGFRLGAVGVEPSSPPGPKRMGEEFGYHAWQEANKFRASRAANRAKGWDKKKKGLQTSKEEEQLATSNQQPAASVVEHMNYTCRTHDATYVETTPPVGLETGVVTPDPTPKPLCMKRFESQYEAKPTSFDMTEEGKAAAARRAAIRADRLKGSSEAR